MSQVTNAIYGDGFVIYDEYDAETGAVETNVDEFLKKYKEMFSKEPCDDVEIYIQDDVASHFMSVNINCAEPVRMLVVRANRVASMYDAPYKTKTHFVNAMKAKLERLGFVKVLGEDFDYEAHIGSFDTCVTS